MPVPNATANVQDVMDYSGSNTTYDAKVFIVCINTTYDAKVFRVGAARVPDFRVDPNHVCTPKDIIPARRC